MVMVMRSMFDKLAKRFLQFMQQLAKWPQFFPAVAVGIFPGSLTRRGREDGEGGARILQSCLLGSWLNGIDADDDDDDDDDDGVRDVFTKMELMTMRPAHFSLATATKNDYAQGCWRMLKDVEGENIKLRFYFQMWKWSHLSIWESWKWLRLEVN